MSEVTRHMFLPRFRRKALEDFQKKEGTLQKERDRVITAENRLLLADLDRQLDLLGLSDYFGQIQKDVDEIQKDHELLSMEDRIQLNVWRVRNAVPGDWMDDQTAIRAVSGYALQFSITHLTLHAGYYGSRRSPLDPSSPYTEDGVLQFEQPSKSERMSSGFSHRLVSNIPTFYILLYTPTSEVVETDQGTETVGVSPTHIYIGSEAENRDGKPNLSRLLGVDERNSAMNEAKAAFERKRFREFMKTAREDAASGYTKKFETEEKEKFRWDTQVSGFIAQEQIVHLDGLFGIQRLTNRTRQLFHRKRKEVKLVKGPYRQKSEVFLEENAGLYPPVVDKGLLKFLQTHPQYSRYMEPLV